MTLDQCLVFRRAALSRAVHSLTAKELRVFLAVALGACPGTRRTWTTALRLSEELARGEEPAESPGAIDAALSVLIARGHLDEWCRGPAALRSYDLSRALVGRDAEPPANLPVEPGVP